MLTAKKTWSLTISRDQAGPYFPYTPHTTGKAGMFYRNRFADLLNPEKKIPARQ
jgi:hypothetical protein